MGKTNYVFKKIGDTKGVFHAKMDTTKARSSKDLTEADDAKKEVTECTEELSRKDLDGLGHRGGEATHPAPGVLGCGSDWAWGSNTANKASGGDGIPAALLKILKDNAVEVLRSTCQQISKTQQWPQEWEMPLFISHPEEW